MKKHYKFEIDCANCAAKVEDAIKKIDGVNNATVSFMTQKLKMCIRDRRYPVWSCPPERCRPEAPAHRASPR